MATPWRRRPGVRCLVNEVAPPPSMHAGQLGVSVDMVQALVRVQFPQWADLPVTAVASHGTVNAIFRLGNDMTARFPLEMRDASVVRDSIRAEAAASRELMEGTRFPVPEPLAVGEAGYGYPLSWTIQTWLPGVTAFVEDPGESSAFAHDLARFITDLRGIDTRGRVFDRPGRGGDLSNLGAWVQTCLHHSEDLLDVPRLRELWHELRSLPRTAPDMMTHGDIVPGNVLVSGGRLAGVLDCGGFGPADPALDLVCAWHLLEDSPRRTLRTALHCDDLEWRRGKAWAFEQALGLVWYYAETNPVMSRMGRRTLQRILADEEAR